MSMEYALHVLKEQKRTVEEKLNELKGYQYEHYKGKSTKKFITELEHKIGDLDFAIEYIEDYGVE